MVEKISVRLTDEIISNKLISENMRDWYIYAFLRIIETSISLFTMILIGIVAGKVVPMILFWAFFDLLRRRAGGFHCDKYWRCYIATTMTFVAIVIIEPILSANPVVLYFLLMVASLQIMIIGTVNHPGIDYDCLELAKSKELSRRILAIELWIIISLFMLGVKETYLTYMSIGVILCAILMSLAKILKQEVRANEEAE